jgi:peptidoglycan/LPS O-acetylase OafA/YrhL
MVKPGMSADTDAPTAPLAIAGVGVLLLVVQSTGAVPAELLGPDVVLAAAGFLVTASLLRRAAADGSMGLGRWYRAQFLLRTPLLVVVPAVVVVLVVIRGTVRQAAQAGADAIASAAGVKNWWDLVTTLPRWTPSLQRLGLDADWYAEHADRVQPLGAFWLLAVLVQLALLWPMLLAVLRTLTKRTPWLLAPALLVLALAAATVGPLRSLVGASQAELALGTHVRATEWLFGAAAAAFVMAKRPDDAPPPGRAAVHALTVLGLALLAATSVLVAMSPREWLGFAGPAIAALGTATLLLAVSVRPDLPLAAGLGRGFPLELGRVAYPLLTLHLFVYWLVQTAVPEARPFALLAVGGALAWLLALLVQDGLIRRAARHPVPTSAVALLLVAAIVTGGVLLDQSAQRRTGSGPVVLVLGGTEAGQLATALTGLGRYSVVDEALPGCGLLPTRAPVPAVRTSTRAQMATEPAPLCGDWVSRWTAEIITSAPEAIVVDLSVDAADPTACDAGFRARYRPLLDKATAVWTGGAPDRPVLVADAPGATRSGRCLGALLAEAVATRGALVPLDVQALLCPAGNGPSGIGTVACDGSGAAPIDDEGSAAIARAVGGVVAAELGPERTAARRQERLDDCGGVGNAGVGDPGC